jgi:hypothetical protein
LHCKIKQLSKGGYMAIIALVFLIGTAAWTLLNAFEG